MQSAFVVVWRDLINNMDALVRTHDVLHAVHVRIICLAAARCWCEQINGIVKTSLKFSRDG